MADPAPNLPPPPPPWPSPGFDWTQVLRERDTFRDEAAALRERVGELEPAAKERDAFKTELETTRTTYAEERALAGAGFADPEAIEALRFAYGKVPEADRPKGGLAEWANGLKKDPAKAPRVLQPFLGTAGKPAPKPGGSDPTPVGDVTLAAIEAAKLSGDLKLIKALEAQLLRELSGR